MILREARMDDCIALSRLHRNTIRKVNSKDYSPEVIEVWSGRVSVNKFRKRIMNSHLYLVEEKGKILGFFGLTKDCENWMIYVHKNYIGKGLGTILMDKMEEIARKTGVKVLKCEASLTAREFYAKRGFKFIEEADHPSEWNGKKVMIRVCLMEKKLG